MMKRNIKLLIISIGLLLTLPVSAQYQEENILVVDDDSLYVEDEADTLPPPLPWPENLQARIDTLLGTKLLDTSDIGLVIWDLTADSCLYAFHPRHRLRPASTMKAVTAITALDKLGGDYRFRTQLRYKGTIIEYRDSTDAITGKTLNGDFWCIGGMDPLFAADDMRAFVNAIRELNVDTIRGNFYADMSFKDKDRLGEGWCWDDDNPTLSPLLIDRKDKFMDKLMQQLRNARIYLDTRQSEQICPTGTTELCTRTHTMDEVLKPMMKNSNNLFAESMFYQLANRTGGKWATAKHARTTVQQVMSKAGVDPKPYYIADGSGLSLYSYLSAEMEVKMLRYAYQNRDIYDHLYASMPIAGVDGTLSGRMGKTSAARNVHAKTGTVTGVSSLAGYCTAANGHVLCFSIINQGMQSHAPARAFQDRVCVALCRTYPLLSGGE